MISFMFQASAIAAIAVHVHNCLLKHPTDDTMHGWMPYSLMNGSFRKVWSVLGLVAACCTLTHIWACTLINVGSMLMLLGDNHQARELSVNMRMC